MRTLCFKVVGQKLTKNGDFSGIIAGSRGYLKCRFDFETSDWRTSKNIAVFNVGASEYAEVLYDAECAVPDQIAASKNFRVRVVGVRGDAYKVMTNQVLVSQEV